MFSSLRLYFCSCVYNAWLITDNGMARACVSVFSHHGGGFHVFIWIAALESQSNSIELRDSDYLSLPFQSSFRNMKMVDIVAQKMPSESDVHMARSFLTKILRSSMRYGMNVTVSRPISFPPPTSVVRSTIIFLHGPSYHPSNVQISIHWFSTTTCALHSSLYFNTFQHLVCCLGMYILFITYRGGWKNVMLQTIARHCRSHIILIPIFSILMFFFFHKAFLI